MQNSKIILKNAKIVNEGKIFESDLLIENNKIDRIDRDITENNSTIINLDGKYIFPGIIDDQVHFRDPGLTHKGNIYSESRSAVAGGVTSFMEMPNTIPNTLTQELLQEKYNIAHINSLANYSFYMGASNDNIEEVLKTNKKNVCGIKIFMGSSTGNMLVNNSKTLENIFSKSNMLIATHCEDEETITNNLSYYYDIYGDDIPMNYHHKIRSEEACFISSNFAVDLAKKYNTRLHILHISTAKELQLFSNKIPIKNKLITSEVCIHHLWWNNEAYDKKGTLIKWNPSIKTEFDRQKLFDSILDDTIDVIATDHAPHLLDEKQNVYTKSSSGGPIVQHSLLAMLDFYHDNKISLEHIAKKMSHDVADSFAIKKRGYIREGYFADLVIIDINKEYNVNKNNILYKCNWSPFENHTFKSSINMTLVNGKIVYSNQKINNIDNAALRLEFDR